MAAERKKRERPEESGPLPVARVSRMDLVREELSSLAETKGRLDPRDVVEAARDESSILHEFFDWNDESAAEKHRILAAGVLIRRVKITIIRQDPETKTLTKDSIRALQSPGSERNTAKEKHGGSYLPSSKIAKDPKLRKALIESVLSELIAIRKRYKEVSELGAVWSAIDEAAK